MPELAFVTLDVFTTTKFCGNPLAVVTIPPDTKLTQDQKQLIAREFNLSETVFVHGVASPSDTRHIDIFLTSAEVPFAGHPTIGAAVSLLDQAVTRLITKAGPVPLRRLEGGLLSASIPHHVRVHQKCVADLLACSDSPFSVDGLQLAPHIREREMRAPVVSIVRGMTFLLVELASLEELAEVQVTPASLPAEQLLDDGWRCGFVGRLYFVRMAETQRHDGGVPVVAFRTRMMECTLEDPATGSAACCLSSYWSLRADRQTTTERRYNITQGVEMGRASNITVQVNVDVNSNDDNRIQSIHLAGTAVQVMRGFVSV